MNQSKEPCLLAANLSQLDATMIAALLADAGVPHFIKDRGIGGYMKLYMGYTVYGQDIYVGQTDYDQAKEILDFYLNTNVDELSSEQDYMTDTPDNIEESVFSHKIVPTKRGTASRIILSLMVLSIVSAMVLNYLSDTGWFDRFKK